MTAKPVALGANKTNGKRLERGDVRKAVEVALREWPNKSQQEIAEQVGCTKQYVGQLKAEISKQVYLPPTRTDSMGRTRPTAYATKTPPSATFNPVLDGGATVNTPGAGPGRSCFQFGAGTFPSVGAGLRLRPTCRDRGPGPGHPPGHLAGHPPHRGPSGA